MVERTAVEARSAAVVRALVTGDVLCLQDLVHPDVLDRTAATGQPDGWAGLRERAMSLCALVHDPAVPVDVLCVDGDTSMCRVHLRAPRRGGLPATDSGLVIVLVLRFERGLLREIWTSTDVQLGTELAPPAYAVPVDA